MKRKEQEERVLQMCIRLRQIEPVQRYQLRLLTQREVMMTEQHADEQHAI